MAVPLWLDVADKVGSVVGALAGVTSLAVAVRLSLPPRGDEAGRPAVPVARRWLWIGGVLGLFAC
ncbi:hypothetical protein [Phytohabitans rumicis]|uniref:Uncharacterized protein n=1 Tax=Phytohabitans rumicis TaxID=1076125 RepID=A0A6V8LME0_9ACTN|nr:hypothetical protein [Phytohabitans rumicis]GFJ95267.1 hypothetical protein Prum_089090 [Phytohabitans rumicis]